jgi:hypothetical protein
MPFLGVGQPKRHRKTKRDRQEEQEELRRIRALVAISREKGDGVGNSSRDDLKALEKDMTSLSQEVEDYLAEASEFTATELKHKVNSVKNRLEQHLRQAPMSQLEQVNSPESRKTGSIIQRIRAMATTLLADLEDGSAQGRNSAESSGAESEESDGGADGARQETDGSDSFDDARSVMRRLDINMRHRASGRRGLQTQPVFVELAPTLSETNTGDLNGMSIYRQMRRSSEVPVKPRRWCRVRVWRVSCCCLSCTTNFCPCVVKSRSCQQGLVHLAKKTVTRETRLYQPFR